MQKISFVEIEKIIRIRDKIENIELMDLKSLRSLFLSKLDINGKKSFIFIIKIKNLEYPKIKPQKE